MCLVGCATGNVPVSDLDAGAYTGPVCCQVSEDFTDAAQWQNGLYPCGDADVPWLCNGDLNCSNPNCMLGDFCQAFNGVGTVTDCQ
jgi:hypothetical protein